MRWAENLHSTGRSGFQPDFPEVTEMLHKFRLSDPQLASLENQINSAPKGQEEQAARDWANEHPEVVNSFTPNG